MSALRISIGADPELAVRDKKSGLFVSAHDKLPGTKLEPHKVKLGAVQVDGVAAEFNIEPSFSSSEFVNNIGEVTLQLQNFIGSDYELVSEPVADFSEGYFKSLPEIVRELGCNPDYNAWSGQVNSKPDGDVFFRTFSGHIHVGWTKDVDPTDSTHYEDCRVIARQMDYYLGMYSLQWDSDTRRRSLYGRAGAFRPKPYGMEYRPLSNVWLRSQKLQHWVWNAAHRAVMDVISGNVVENEFGDAAERIINNSVLWFKPDFANSSEEKRARDLYRLSAYTGLENPPPLPKPSPKTTPGKRVRPKANHKYVGNSGELVSIDIEAGPPGTVTSTTNPGHITLTQFAQTLNPVLQMPQWGLSGNLNWVDVGNSTPPVVDPAPLDNDLDF